MRVDKLNIDDLLRFMVEQEASDLHLKPMRPPLIRLNGKLLPLKMNPVPPESISRMLDQILTDLLARASSYGFTVDDVLEGLGQRKEASP